MTLIAGGAEFAADGSSRPRPAKRRNATRVGYVGLADAAPLFVAKDLGLFERHGLNVVLQREVGWATIREKVAFGELEAAHALCPLPFASTLGLGSAAPTPCVSAMILSRGGNAIVLSSELWKRGVRDGRTLQMDIENRRFFRKYILATVFPCSTHAFVLRDWLHSAGIDADRDVQMVTLPPSQMCRNLAAGTIDGFCSGDPWASMAILQEIGWSPATSIDISPDHPEKALMTSERFALANQDEHLSLLAALIEACAICDRPENRRAVAALACDRRRVNCPIALLERCLSSEFDYGMGRCERKHGFIRFYAGDANRPGKSEVDWIVKRMVRSGVEIPSTRYSELEGRVFRPDIFDEALRRADVKGALALAASELQSLQANVSFARRAHAEA